DELNSEINAILNGSKLDFKVHARRLHDPRVDFQLDADTLDFNKLFPPAVAEAKPEGDAGKGKDKDKEAKDAAPVPPASDAKQAPQPESTLDLRMLEALDVT